MDKTLETLIEEFWTKEVWKSNTKYIYNERIKNTLIQIQKLSHNLKPKKKFILSSDGDFKVKNDNKVENLINQLKKENINYIKTHADCIPEYHNLIISIKNNLFSVLSV
jgi:hypothetical protein